MSALKIGEVARRAGVAVDTVRYYERLGLLPAAARRSSGYRMFDDGAVERIRLVKHLQSLGLTLEDVGAMCLALTRDGADCAREAPRIAAALARTEEKIAALREVETRLRGALASCADGSCDLVARARRLGAG